MSGGVKEVSAEYRSAQQVDDCPAGYKRTEVGVVPEDWDVKPLTEFISTLEAGVSVNSVERSELSTHDKFILKTSCVFGGYFDPKEAKSILPKDLNRAKLNPRKNSILVSRMNTPALVGEVGFIDDDYLNLYLPDRLWQSKYKNDESVDGKWLSFILSFPRVAKKIKETATGTSNSMKNISKGSFLSVTVPAPPVKEQTAIANALSDVDALIASIEKLITKKRAIKTSTMQQLLTGKKRLPPFDKKHTGYKQTELGEIPEDWDVVELGGLVSIASGESPSKFEFIDSGIPYYKVEQLNAHSKYADETEYFFKSGSTIKSGSVIFPKRGASILLNKIRMLKNDSYMDTNLMCLTCHDELDSEFLFYFLSYEGLDSVADTTSIPQINNKHINPFLIPFFRKEEQLLIAGVLSDIDKEIEALEQRLTKTQQLKQGMMQELLTGKTRLIKPEQEAA